MFWVALGALALGCGTNGGPVLELIEPRVPPEAHPRMDVLLVRSVESCAIGEPCSSADPDECFHLSDAEGPVLLFEPPGLQFVPPDDERVQTAELSGCFRLDMDDETAAAWRATFDALRTRIFQLSEGRIDIELQTHDLGPIDAGFKRWEGRTGLFLEPTALSDALPLVSRETDYSFAVTGLDPMGGYLPRIELCGGSNWEEQGGFAGTAYTWLSANCDDPTGILGHFFIQTGFALRDVNDFPDPYDGDYPACGNASRDPSEWFPSADECSRDPDSPTCGQRCQFDDAFASHVLRAHFPASFIGNHCRNGVMDWDETDVDAGGVCDRVGR
jgi:hypothetical protein